MALEKELKLLRQTFYVPVPARDVIGSICNQAAAISPICQPVFNMLDCDIEKLREGYEAWLGQ